MNFNETKDLLITLASILGQSFWQDDNLGTIQRIPQEENGWITDILTNQDETREVRLNTRPETTITLVVIDRQNNGECGVCFERDINPPMMLTDSHLQFDELKNKPISQNDPSFIYSSYLTMMTFILPKFQLKEQ